MCQIFFLRQQSYTVKKKSATPTSPNEIKVVLQDYHFSKSGADFVTVTLKYTQNSRRLRRHAKKVVILTPSLRKSVTPKSQRFTRFTTLGVGTRIL